MIIVINNTPNADGAKTMSMMRIVVVNGLRCTKSIIESIKAVKKFIDFLMYQYKIIAKLQKNRHSMKYLLVVWINLINFGAK
jgi:hypothetical protein